jgi:hypothetical protein
MPDSTKLNVTPNQPANRVSAIQPSDDSVDPENDTIALEYFATQSIDHTPLYEAFHQRGEDTLAPSSSVILQMLPAGTCLILDLDEPVVLGRQVRPYADNLVDLSQYKAYRHGISRRHCLLKRRGTELVVMDLGSANGTYINNVRLPSFVDHNIAHGDRLILGDLHINVFFSAIDRPYPAENKIDSSSGSD